MRLRIVHQLSFLLAGAVLLSVAGVGGLVAWNLKTGFSDYLRTRDSGQLERFAQVVADRAALEPSLEWLAAGRMPIRELMDEFLRREGLLPESARNRPPPRARQAPPPRRGEPGDPAARGAARQPGADAPAAPPPVAEAPPPAARDSAVQPEIAQRNVPTVEPTDRFVPAGVIDGPLPPGAPGNGGPEADLPRRIQIVDLQRQRIGGPPFPPQQPLLEEPVRANGRLIAYVRMQRSTELQTVDARFLARQYTGLGVAAALTLALALLAAWLAAHWFGRPLRKLQEATQRIAGGELDVTVPESGSREMAGLIRDVNRMAASLKSLEGARRSWVAQISHELRTPLSVLLGELESIQDGARQPTPAVVAGLRDEVLQLVRLVNDLHTLSMADLGALPCEFSDGDANAALARTVGRFSARAARASLQVQMHAGATPARARWDFGRIDQLMANLLENSLRYTAAPGTVRVQWSFDGAMAEVRVEDTPPGVDPRQLELMFEPLFRADSSRHRTGTGDPASGGASGAGSSGSGLGLAICRAIVQAHGGRIHAQPSALGGMCIVVRLPLNPET